MSQSAHMARKAWDVEFTAQPEEVGTLRRLVQQRLSAWGLDEIVDTAQLCVSELVSNVVTHVGPGTPGALALSLTGRYLRIEVHDPDARALPTLVAAEVDAESGRGMALVEALTDRWGVELREDRKATWCELATGLTPPAGRSHDPSVTRAEALLGMYATLRPLACSHGRRSSKLERLGTEESVVDIITDFLRWLHERGFDTDQVLDWAQSRFEATLPGGDGRAGSDGL